MKVSFSGTCAKVEGYTPRGGIFWKVYGFIHGDREPRVESRAYGDFWSFGFLAGLPERASAELRAEVEEAKRLVVRTLEIEAAYC